MIHHLQHLVDLVEICRLKGIQQIVVSPGSRNAPLINLFASHSSFKLHSIVDERSAGFYGLGIALKTQKPVALICTSGTAVLNYASALAEAYYQHIPLIAITADRPEELIDQQDNQTIRQVNVYSNYIRESIHLHQPLKDKYELEAQHYAINKIINTSITGMKGPVHINVPIAEPLYVEMPACSTNIQLSDPEEQTASSTAELKNNWEKAPRRLIICGEGPRDKKLNEQLNILANDGTAIVLAEPISNIKGKNILSEVDRLMMWIETEKSNIFNPELLISVGGPVVSKRLKLWLQKQKQLKHFRLTKEEDQIDTYRNISGTIIGNPFEVLEEITEKQVESGAKFIREWKSAYANAEKKHTLFLKNAPYSDIAVFNSILNNLPSDCSLHLGNSSPVRYAQLFDLSACHSVYSNRGVSGIDGCLSTAAGFASQSDKLNLLIIGDLSFLYDSNGLWNAKLPINLKVIVINNEGGGIFRMIPGPSKMDAFEEFMETKHPVDISKLCAAFGVDYLSCESKPELDEKINQFIKSKKGPALLEIKTPRMENAEVYKEYVTRIKTEDR